GGRPPLERRSIAPTAAGVGRIGAAAVAAARLSAPGRVLRPRAGVPDVVDPDEAGARLPEEDRDGGAPCDGERARAGGARHGPEDSGAAAGASATAARQALRASSPRGHGPIAKRWEPTPTQSDSSPAIA